MLIGKLRGAAVEPIVAWRDGALFDAPTYPLVGTPCETVQRSDVCYYPDPERLLEAVVGALGGAA